MIYDITFWADLLKSAIKQVWNLYGMGLGPLKGLEKFCILDALWCIIRPFRGPVANVTEQ